MPRLSDVLVAWAVESQSQWERPVDMEAALDRALAGMRLRKAQLRQAQERCENVRKGQDNG